MFPARLDIFQNEPLLRLTKVMSLNGLLRAMVTNYLAALSADPSYTFMGLTRDEVIEGLQGEIKIVLAQLEALDPLTRDS